MQKHGKNREYVQSHETCRYHFSHSRSFVKEPETIEKKVKIDGEDTLVKVIKSIDRHDLSNYVSISLDNCCSCQDMVKAQEALPLKERKFAINTNGKNRNGRPYKDGKKYLVIFPDKLTEEVRTTLDNGKNKLLVDAVSERLRTSSLTVCGSCEYYEPMR